MEWDEDGDEALNYYALIVIDDIVCDPWIVGIKTAIQEALGTSGAEVLHVYMPQGGVTCTGTEVLTDDERRRDEERAAGRLA